MKNSSLFDFKIIFSFFIIEILSLSMIWSLKADLFLNQLIFFIIGFVLFFIFSIIDFRIFENFSYHFYLFSLIFLFSPFFFGQVTRGSLRWIQIGGFTVQPSEIVKPFLVCSFAAFLSKKEKNFRVLDLIKIFFLFLLPLFLVFKQPDLGSSLLIFSSFLGVFFVSGIPFLYIAGGLMSLIISFPVIWIFLKEYQKLRIISFLNPYHDPLGAGYHLIQSVAAVGSGQIFGRGFGKGIQSHLHFLPENYTDFIFASLSEEMGFLGSLLLLVCYFVLLLRILKISQNSTSSFGSAVGFGFFSLFLFQIFANIGMNMGLLPVVGITLPLFSYGGSSIIATMISLGIIESIFKFQKQRKIIEIK